MRGLEVEQAGDEEIAAQVRHQHAEGGEHSGRRRHDHLADAQLGGECGAVHGAAAAEYHQGEVARIAPAVERDQLERIDHVVVGQAQDAARHFGAVQTEPSAERVERAIHRRHVGTHAAAAEELRVDPAERQVGVGGGGRLAAAAIGGRPRRGAGALRTDVQLAEIIHPGDRAATVADLDQVHHRHHDRVAGRTRRALDPVVGGDGDLAVLDQRAFGGGAADVQGKHVGLAEQAAECGGAEEAAGRAGLDHGDRDRAGRLDGFHAAVGLHDVERSAIAALAQPRGQSVEVALGHRLHVGREHGRVAAFVLAPLAGDLVRGDHAHLRPQPAHLGQHGLLVRGVGVGVQEADRHRLDACGAEVIQDAGQGGKIQWLELVAAIVHAAGQLAAQMARHEGRRLHVIEVEEIGPVAARDLEHVAKATGGDEPGMCTLALGQRIDDHRGAVRHEGDLGECEAALVEHVEHAAFEIGRRGVGLGGAHHLTAGDRIAAEADQVGERAADVGGYA